MNPNERDHEFEIDETDDGELRVFCYIVVDWEPFSPGRTWGPPELCYPDEGGNGSLMRVEWCTTPAKRDLRPGESVTDVTMEEAARLLSISKESLQKILDTKVAAKYDDWREADLCYDGPDDDGDAWSGGFAENH